MDTIHKLISNSIQELLEENPEKAKDIDVKDVLSEVMPNVTKTIKDLLMNSTDEMLKQRHKQYEGFRKRNVERWEKGFHALEILIAICTEAGEEFNRSYRPEAARQKTWFLI